MEQADGPLLGHHVEPATSHKDNPARRRDGTSLGWFRFTVMALLVLASVFFILYLQWHSAAFHAPEAAVEDTTPPQEAVEPIRDMKILLHPEQHVSRRPEVRRFSWNVTKSILAPDGVEKHVFLINDQFPGPTIEARSGDTLEIDVINLTDEGLSIHWHGLHMRGMNHMDGPIGITQCAIQPGARFTYRVPTNQQAGTFWYHAHSEVHRADGLLGGLVIHDPSTLENSTYQYDSELLFLVGDWYHSDSQTVLQTFMTWDNGGLEPPPESLLINGLGQFDCSRRIPSSPVNCSGIERPSIALNKRQRYRARLVNVGALSGLSFTIPDSEIKVIQVDGGSRVVSHLANSVGILYPGERADFILAWPDSAVAADTEVIITLDPENYPLAPVLAKTQAFLVVSETSTQRNRRQEEPEIILFNLQEAKGLPLTSPLPDIYIPFMVYTSILVLPRLHDVPTGFVNGTHWKPQNAPLVTLGRQEWDEFQLVAWSGAEPVWVELTINNMDATGHPFHLHGFHFYVVASYEGHNGWNYYNPFKSKPPRGGAFNLVDPILKDTVYVPRYGYAVIRFLADNEGVWALHCHFLWHQASGMMMAFQVLGDEQHGVSNSETGLAAKQLCMT